MVTYCVSIKHYQKILHFTGALSLLASKRVRGCVGVEEVKTAVEDATFNAERNNITNCNFISGTVEQVSSYISTKDNDELKRPERTPPACCQY